MRDGWPPTWSHLRILPSKFSTFFLHQSFDQVANLKTPRFCAGFTPQHDFCAFLKHQTLVEESGAVREAHHGASGQNTRPTSRMCLHLPWISAVAYLVLNFQSSVASRTQQVEHIELIKLTAEKPHNHDSQRPQPGHRSRFLVIKTMRSKIMRSFLGPRVGSQTLSTRVKPQSMHT